MALPRAHRRPDIALALVREGGFLGFAANEEKSGFANSHPKLFHDDLLVSVLSLHSVVGSRRHQNDGLLCGCQWEEGNRGHSVAPR